MFSRVVCWPVKKRPVCLLLPGGLCKHANLSHKGGRVEPDESTWCAGKLSVSGLAEFLSVVCWDLECPLLENMFESSGFIHVFFSICLFQSPLRCGVTIPFVVDSCSRWNIAKVRNELTVSCHLDTRFRTPTGSRTGQFGSPRM